LSEEICKPFGEEMEIVNREFHTYNTNHGGDTVQKKGVISYSELWKEENLGEFDSLRAVRDFVANCHEQDERIRRLSLERGDDIFKEVMPKELNTVKKLLQYSNFRRKECKEQGRSSVRFHPSENLLLECCIYFGIIIS
jgi:hypothetical protein